MSALDDVMAELCAATERLLYPSESDEPVTARVFERPFPWEAEEEVEETGADEFFEGVVGTDAAAGFHALYGVMAGRLTDLRVYRVGAVRVGVYVVGVEPGSGAAVGVETVSIET